jgi:hypothetical protein
VEGREVRIDPKDVVHFRFGIDPLNQRQGLSPLAATLREVCTDNEINNYSASVMRNMGVPGLVVSPKNETAIIPWGQESAMKERFLSHFTGDERGKPLVNTVPLDITVPGFNPDQLAIEIMRKVPEERITAALGIPAGVVGLGAGLDRNTFNNYKEARQAAFENCIAPMQKLMADVLNRQLLPDFEGGGGHEGVETSPHDGGSRPFTSLNYKNVSVLQEDLNKKADRVTMLFEKDVLKRSEARAALDYKFDKSTDDKYWSEIEKDAEIEVAKAQPKPVMGAGGKGP